MLTDRDIELELVVCVVWLSLAQVPRDAGAAKHDTAESAIECLLSRDHPNVHKTLAPDAAARQQLRR